MSRATLEQRADAIRRRFVDGTPAAALAHELGVSVPTVNGWIDQWKRRVGAWSGKPIEPWAAALGFDLAVEGGKQRVRYPRSDSWLSEAEIQSRGARGIFTAKLARVPSQYRHDLIEIFQLLDDEDRDRFAPALDVYLQAGDLMDEVRRLVKRASAIVAGEILHPSEIISQDGGV